MGKKNYTLEQSNQGYLSDGSEDVFYSDLEESTDQIKAVYEANLRIRATQPTSLENPQKKKKRYMSLYVCFAVMLFINLQFSIVISSLWPYLKNKLDPNANQSILGWIVAAFSIGQAVSSPVYGFFFNKFEKIRGLLIVSLILSIVGNGWYCLLNLHDPSIVVYCMIAARVVVGFSAGNVACVRSYVAAATTVKERTTAISAIAGFQALGFALGPPLQAACEPLGEDGVTLGRFAINLYTLPGWIGALLSLICLVLLSPCIFQEFNVAKEEAKTIVSGDLDISSLKVDKLAIAVLLFAFFVNMSIFTLLESLFTPMVMDMYAWISTDAVVYVGIMFLVSSIITIVIYLTLGKVTKRFEERKIVIIVGFFGIFLAVLTFIPFGNGPNFPLQNGKEIVTEKPFLCPSSKLFQGPDGMSYLRSDPSLPFIYRSGSLNDTIEPPGCNVCEKPWCDGSAITPLYQLIIGMVILSLSYPVCLSIIQSIYSKVMGPKPQGSMMALLTITGSAARIIGPIYVTYAYTHFGLALTLIIILGFTILIFIFSILTYKRLVPMNIIEQSKARY